jgi:hypothetical protein
MMASEQLMFIGPEFGIGLFIHVSIPAFLKIVDIADNEPAVGTTTDPAFIGNLLYNMYWVLNVVIKVRYKWCEYVGNADTTESIAAAAGTGIFTWAELAFQDHITGSTAHIGDSEVWRCE